MALMPVADALSAILAGAEPLPEEMVALDAGHHRVLARDLAALRTQPPQAMSAMDGYAVRAADAAQVGARFKVIGEVAAGRPFDRAVGAGEAVRIFTGGVIPEGADAIVIQEDTEVDGGDITITEATDRGPAYPPRRRRLQQGRRAADGRQPPHRPRPVAGRQHELSGTRGAAPAEGRGARHRRRTGDAGLEPGPGQIVYSNGYALRALARAEGAETIDLGIAADTVEATTARHPPRPRQRRRYPDHHRRRLGRRPRPRQAVAGGRGRRHGVLADRDAAGQADDAWTARRHAGDRPARQSGVVLCLRVPVSGAVDSRFVGPLDASIMCRETRVARARCRRQRPARRLSARPSRGARRRRTGSPRRSTIRTARCWEISLRHGHL